MFVRDTIYKVDCTEGAYVYAIKNDHGITLIDTNFPGKGGDVLAELASVGLDQVDRILLTHIDGDHIGGAKAIQDQTGCKVYLSAREQEAIDDPTKNKTYGERKNTLEGLEEPTLTVLEGDEIGGLQIIPAYGHTWGHTCYRFGDVLFCGDLVQEENGGWVELALRYIRDREQSWIAIQEVSDNNEFTLVCPTHGEPLECDRIEFVKREE